MVDARDLDIVILAAGAVAQFGKFEPDNVVSDPTTAQVAAVYLQALPLHTRLRREALKASQQALVGLFVQGRVVQLGLLQRTQPVVDTAVDVYHLGMGFHGLYRGQEALPLQTVAIQLVRYDIRRCHQRDAAAEKGLHEPPQYHRVGDV